MHTFPKRKPIPRRFGKITKRCKECGREFDSFPSKMRAYCSHRCANAIVSRRRQAKAATPVTCRGCGKQFVKRASDLKSYGKSRHVARGRYCSSECWRLKIQTMSSAKIAAWNAFALYIKERDRWTCYTCGKVIRGSTMHAGHFVSRRHNATLFDEMNVHAQCAGCNMFQQGNTHVYAERLIKEFGQQAFMELVERSRTFRKFTKQELAAIRDTYRQKTAEITSNQ